MIAQSLCVHAYVITMPHLTPSCACAHTYAMLPNKIEQFQVEFPNYEVTLSHQHARTHTHPKFKERIEKGTFISLEGEQKIAVVTIIQ